MGVMLDSFLWVTQDLDHQPYDSVVLQGLGFGI